MKEAGFGMEKNFLEDLLDFTNIYIWVLELIKKDNKEEFRYVYLSPGIEKFTGIKREELIGKPSTWDQYVVPEDRYILRRTLSLLHKKKEIHERYRIIDNNGNLRYVESVVYPIFSKEKELVGIKGYTIDATDRIKRELKIREANKYLSVLSKLALMFLESEDIYDIASRMVELLGKTACVDRAYWIETYTKNGELYSTIRAEWTREGVTPQINNPKLKEYPNTEEFSETHELLSKGKIYHVRISDIKTPYLRKFLEDQDIKAILLSPIYIKGQYLGLLGFDNTHSEDLWEREKISFLKTASEIFGSYFLRIKRENELKTLTLRFKTLVESMPVLVAFRDESGRWIYANSLAEKYLELKDIDYIGKTTEEIVGLIKNPDIQKIFESAIESDRKVLEKGKEFTYIHKYYSSQGKEIYIEFRKKPIINESGEIVGIVAIGIDITEERRQREEKEQMQKRLLQKQKLESLGLMASGIAHDFNNILTAISGNLSLLESFVDSDRAYKYINRINDAMERAKSLIQTMFLSAGKPSSPKKKIEVNEEIENLYNLIKTGLLKHINVIIEKSNVPLHIFIDPVQFQQIIMNIVINAGDAIGEKEGNIWIRVREVDLSYESINKLSHPMNAKEGRYVLVEIKDNGPGIPKDILEKIFDPFYSTKKTGKGLGLSIVFGTLNNIGGAINLISKEGEGTTFQIFFPLNKDI